MRVEVSDADFVAGLRDGRPQAWIEAAQIHIGTRAGAFDLAQGRDEPAIKTPFGESTIFNGALGLRTP